MHVSLAHMAMIPSMISFLAWYEISDIVMKFGITKNVIGFELQAIRLALVLALFQWEKVDR